MSVKQVIVIRTDLNMRKGKMCAQAAHASMKVFLDEGRVDTWESLSLDVSLWPDAVKWLEGAFTKVVVGCSSEAELSELHRRAQADGLMTALIVDNGATEFHGVPTPTALAIGPHDASKIDPITGHLKLL